MSSKQSNSKATVKARVQLDVYFDQPWNGSVSAEEIRLRAIKDAESAVRALCTHAPSMSFTFQLTNTEPVITITIIPDKEK